jgi:hypothetical protein
VAAGVTAGVGITQAIVGGIRAHSAQKQIEKLQSPTYQPNQAIADYYQTARNKAETSPYQSQFYQMAEKNAGRGLATGISALQDRRSTGNVAGLVEGEQDSLAKAGVQGEALQRQAMGQYGQATSMKASDDKYAFDVNKEEPFERQYSLLAAKAGGGNQMENAGISNIAQGANEASQGAQNKKYMSLLASMGGSGGYV